MGPQGVQMKGALPWLVRWACRAGTRDVCSALASSLGRVVLIRKNSRIWSNEENLKKGSGFRIKRLYRKPFVPHWYA